MLHAVAIIHRGGLEPGQLTIQCRKWDIYAHSLILLSDGRVAEASALENQFLVHADRPQQWWEWQSSQRSLLHLGHVACEDIAARCLRMRGMGYDWRAARGQALEGLAKPDPDDPRRVICYEGVARATEGYLIYDRPLHTVDRWDIDRAWRKSFY